MSGLPLWFVLYSRLVESHVHRDVTFGEVQGILGLSSGHVKQVIRRLLKMGLLVGHCDPLDKRFTLYRVVPFSLWSKYYGLRDGLAGPLRGVLPLLFSIEGVHVILLLGSHARGDFDEKSDVDVLVVCDDPKRVLDFTYHACLGLPIDLHACTPDEFRGSLYLLVQHAVLYDDGTYGRMDLSKFDVMRLLRDAIEGAEKVLCLYREGLVGFHRVFSAIYELILVDSVIHGSADQRKMDVLERFFAGHSSVKDLRDDLFRLLRVYENLTKGKGGGVEGLDRGREVETFSRIVSEVGVHVRGGS